MKKTSPLDVVFSHHFPKGVITMHPNAGFELGMMLKEHKVVWTTGLDTKDFLQGQSGNNEAMMVDLHNNCPAHQLRLSSQHFKSLGEISKAVVFYDGERLFIHALPVVVSK